MNSRKKLVPVPDETLEYYKELMDDMILDLNEIQDYLGKKNFKSKIKFFTAGLHDSFTFPILVEIEVEPNKFAFSHSFDLIDYKREVQRLYEHVTLETSFIDTIVLFNNKRT